MKSIDRERDEKILQEQKSEISGSTEKLDGNPSPQRGANGPRDECTGPLVRHIDDGCSEHAHGKEHQGPFQILVPKQGAEELSQPEPGDRGEGWKRCDFGVAGGDLEQQKSLARPTIRFLLMERLCRWVSRAVDLRAEVLSARQKERHGAMAWVERFGDYDSAVSTYKENPSLHWISRSVRSATDGSAASNEELHSELHAPAGQSARVSLTAHGSSASGCCRILPMATCRDLCHRTEANGRDAAPSLSEPSSREVGGDGNV